MAITSDELQSIVSAVLSSIRTNSRTIDQLTPVTALADTDNLEVHGGKRVVFSILRNLILSKSGVDELKTELKPKLAELDDVVEIHSVRSDIGVILAQPSGPLTVYHGSTDEGYGVVYDSTRKRFYLVGTSALSNPNTDVSVIQAYGDWSDEAVFGDSPESGSGRIPVRGKIYVCATDGGLYYWNGTDLVDLIKGILANTNALSVLNRRGQVGSFAAVLTTDPDNDPIPASLVGKRVWSTQLQKFIDVTATEEVGGVYPYTVPDDASAVENKFYISDDNLYLGIKLADTTTSLLPLFATAIAEHSHTHKITLTAGDDGTLSWSGANFNNMRNGDVIEWENMGVLFRGTVISRTSSGSYDTLAVVYDFDGDEPLELHVLWINSNGTATDACFSSDQTLASAFNAKQTKLEDTTDVVIESETNTTDGLYLTDSAKRAVFIDRWNARCVDMYGNKCGGYNEATGYFELNGLTDITYAQAMEIMSSASYWCRTPIGSMPSMSLLNIRTAFPFGGYGNSLGAVALNSTFKNCEKLEVVVVQDGNFASLNGTFSGCKKLRKVALNTSYSTGFDNAAFYQCYALEELSVLPQILSNINLSPCSRLSVASASNITAKGKSGITVTVHADVFAKLTGDMTNEAAAALTDDEKAAWAAVLEAACAKNISFAAA